MDFVSWGLGVLAVNISVPDPMFVRLDQPYSNACESDGEFSTLRVKSEDGEKTFILKMRATQTVGDLRQYLDKHR